MQEISENLKYSIVDYILYVLGVYSEDIGAKQDKLKSAKINIDEKTYDIFSSSIKKNDTEISIICMSMQVDTSTDEHYAMLAVNKTVTNFFMIDKKTKICKLFLNASQDDGELSFRDASIFECSKVLSGIESLVHVAPVFNKLDLKNNKMFYETFIGGMTLVDDQIHQQ